MQWTRFSTHNCPVGQTLDLLGEKWTLLIVRDALNGVRRFDDFRQHMGLSEAVLADRLRKLVEVGVLETRPYQEPGQRERNEYRVTPKGRELSPVITALRQWGDKYMPDPAGPVVELRHRGCEGEVRLALICEDHPHERLTPSETYAVAGPGACLRDEPAPRTKRA